MADYSRTHLVTKLICTQCGGLLTMGVKVEKHDRLNNCSRGEPTGADGHWNYIPVHPCERCLKPVKQMSQALRTLSKLAEEDTGDA